MKLYRVCDTYQNVIQWCGTAERANFVASVFIAELESKVSFEAAPWIEVSVFSGKEEILAQLNINAPFKS